MVSTRKVSDQREFLNALYYGDGGTGKTTDLATMANHGRVLYVDAESGIKRRPLQQLGVNVDNIELPEFDGPLEWKMLDDLFWQVKSDLDADPDSWFGVVLDSGSELSRAFIDNVVGKRVTKAERLGTKSDESMKDQFFVDLDSWGTMTQQFRLLIRHFRDLPCHFGMSFLERRDKEKSGAVRVGPAINPGLQSDVVGWHDVVCHTTVDANYIGYTRPEGIMMGKDRYGALPRAFVDPTFERMLAYINGELTEADDPLQVEAEEAVTDQDAIAAVDGVAPEGNAIKKKATKAAVKEKLTPLERAKAAAAAREAS